MATDLNNAILQALRVTPPQLRNMPQQWTPNPNDLRADKTKKGNGYLGVLRRPDGGVSTEISIGVNLGGKEMEIPTLIPTLNPDEINYLLSAPQDAPIPRQIIDKAVQHAKTRLSQNLSPFAN